MVSILGVKLFNFRNYQNLDFSCSERSVVLIGNNGSGKTNLLESISLLSKSQGIKNANLKEIQNYDYASNWGVHYKILNSQGVPSSVGIARNNNKKLVKINDEIQTNILSLHNLISVIWLVPQLDHIFLKSRSEKLKFFDRIVYLFEKDYATDMTKYEKAKTERASLLQNKSANGLWLDALEEVLAATGTKIAATRCRIITLLQRYFKKSFSIFPRASLLLQSQVKVLENPPNEKLCHYRQELRNHRIKDSLSGRTNFGIHNDHFCVKFANCTIDAQSYSTGEQKALLVSLILACVQAKYDVHQTMPVLLFDDIMSHLDQKYRTALLDTILQIGCQTWISDVNISNFANYDKEFDFYHICDNEVTLF